MREIWVERIKNDSGREKKTMYCSLQPPPHAGSSLADFSTLKMEAIRSSEMSVHTRFTQRHIPQDGILHFALEFKKTNNSYIYYYFKHHRILVGKPEGRRSLGRPRRRWVDNIKMDLREIGWGWDGLRLKIGTSGGLL
jgi:hypothetical protein